MKGLNSEYILPTMDEWDVFPREAAAVAAKAVEQLVLDDHVIAILGPLFSNEALAAALKAGILEIADVFAVNKADKEGADRTIRDLRGMLELRPPTADPAGSWTPPIQPTMATAGQGLEELVAALGRHRSFLVETGELGKREVARARTEFVAHLRERLLEAGLAALAAIGTLDELALRIARREQDPYALGEALARELSRRPPTQRDRP